MAPLARNNPFEEGTSIMKSSLLAALGLLGGVFVDAATRGVVFLGRSDVGMLLPPLLAPSFDVNRRNFCRDSSIL